MKKFITLLTGCSLALAVSVRAEQEDPKKKSVQRSRPVLKQQFAPKQHPMTNNRVPGVHIQRNNAPIHNNVRIRDNNVPKQQIHRLPAVQPNKLPVVRTNKFPTVHPNEKTVRSFHPQHLNFHAKPNPVIASVKFNQNFHIRGSENWSGNQYNVFRSYRPQWHDRGWWHSHHNHILLIGGGWYFWNAGYWYPAWGYDASAAYYPYDGPIYVGNSPTRLDQVVADVQSALQEQGYYNGEVDGLVGPLTQEALAAYQNAQGLEPTAAIDQPTLESLGLG